MTTATPVRGRHDASTVVTRAMGALEGVPAPQPRRRVAAHASVASAALLTVAALLLGFVLEVAALGALRHGRDQEVAFARLRLELASGTAPLGALDSKGNPMAVGTPVALLEVPAAGIKEVVSEGTAAGVLRSGPGHRRDTVLPGQVGTSVVMGRKAGYGAPFRNLARLRPGQRITVTTGQGRQRFTVLSLRRAGDPQPPPPAVGAARLMLVTASGPAFVPDGALRVDAVLDRPGLAVPSARPGIGDAERALGTDSSALVPLVLWLQCLLLLGAGLTWARHRWGLWQAWLAGVPLVAWAGLNGSDAAACLLPNLL